MGKVDHKPSQNQKILDYIERFGSITPLEAMKDLGIMRFGSRICDLRRLGYPLVGEWEEVDNRFGEKTRIKRFRMGCE